MAQFNRDLSFNFKMFSPLTTPLHLGKKGKTKQMTESDNESDVSIVTKDIRKELKSVMQKAAIESNTESDSSPFKTRVSQNSQNGKSSNKVTQSILDSGTSSSEESDIIDYVDGNTPSGKVTNKPKGKQTADSSDSNSDSSMSEPETNNISKLTQAKTHTKKFERERTPEASSASGSDSDPEPPANSEELPKTTGADSGSSSRSSVVSDVSSIVSDIDTREDSDEEKGSSNQKTTKNDSEVSSIVSDIDTREDSNKEKGSSNQKTTKNDSEVSSIVSDIDTREDSNEEKGSSNQKTTRLYRGSDEARFKAPKEFEKIEPSDKDFLKEDYFKGKQLFLIRAPSKFQFENCEKQRIKLDGSSSVSDKNSSTEYAVDVYRNPSQELKSLRSVQLDKVDGGLALSFGHQLAGQIYIKSKGPKLRKVEYNKQSHVRHTGKDIDRPPLAPFGRISPVQQLLSEESSRKSKKKKKKIKKERKESEMEVDSFDVNTSGDRNMLTGDRVSDSGETVRKDTGIESMDSANIAETLKGEKRKKKKKRKHEEEMSIDSASFNDIDTSDLTVENVKKKKKKTKERKDEEVVLETSEEMSGEKKKKKKKKKSKDISE